MKHYTQIVYDARPDKIKQHRVFVHITSSPCNAGKTEHWLLFDDTSLFQMSAQPISDSGVPGLVKTVVKT